MNLPGISKVALKLFPLILFVIMGDFCISRTGAIFFIETTEKTKNAFQITLYECDSVENSLDTLQKTSKKRPSTTTIESPKNPKDVICDVVTKRQRKQQIYSTVNFYLATTDAMLDEGRRIVKRKKRSNMKELPTFISSLVGISLIGRVGECPTFHEVSSGAPGWTLLRDKCHNDLVVTKFLEDRYLCAFVQYMGVLNYKVYFQPTQELIEQVKLFGEVVKAVQELYDRDVRFARQNQVNQQTQTDARKKVQSAVELLIQKLIDPCFMLALTGGIDAQKIALANKEAKTHCHNYCTFLAVGFSAHRVGSSECGNTLIGGKCDLYRCSCAHQKTMYRIKWPLKYIHMVKCSNDLRVGIAAAKSKSGGKVPLVFLRRKLSKVPLSGGGKGK